MEKVKAKPPFLYMPSSGSMCSVKLRMSSGFGKCVRMVRPSESSERSVSVREWVNAGRVGRTRVMGETGHWGGGMEVCTFLHPDLGGGDLFLLLRVGVGGFLLLLFLCYLGERSTAGRKVGTHHGPYLQHCDGGGLVRRVC